MTQETRTQKGQSTLELIIALAIIAITMASIIALFFGGQSLLIDTQTAQEGGYLLRQSLEEARSLARTNFAGLVSTSSNIGDFTLERTVNILDEHTKQVIEQITWATDPIREQELELVAVLTDWRNVIPPVDPDDPPGGSPSGDWMNPRTLGSIDVIPSGNQGTGVDVVGTFAYITAEMPSADKPDFFVADVSNPRPHQSPIASLNTGPGLNAVDATIGYAYVANRSNTQQLQIINISNPGSPSLVTGFTLPGTSGPNAIGQSIFYASPYVYVGAGSASGPEFHIVNVGTPDSPVSAGYLEIGSAVNAIAVQNRKAYLGTSDVNEEIKIIDVSDPALPTQIGGYNIPSNGAAVALVLQGDTLFVTRNSNSDKELFVFNVSDPDAVQSLGSKEFTADVPGLEVQNCLAFIGSTNSNKEFQVHNVDDPGDIEEWSSFNFPQVVTDIDYSNNLVYTAVRSNEALRIITSATSSVPTCQ